MRGLGLLITSVLLLGACGGEATTTTQPGGQGTEGAAAQPRGQTTATQPDGQPAATTGTAPSTPATSGEVPAARGTVIKVADSRFGPMLFDRTGQAIYLFDKEKTSTPECYNACAEAWPPVLTEGAPQATAGARADKLSTTKRADGTTQVTYAGHPLYFYAHEGKNQVLCHNVRGFGGLWLVVTPAGNPAPA
jgi:predicted lipoprotein with Yx(FWY)xxD motif